MRRDENTSSTSTVRGAWVGQCPACRTCCFFSKFPASDYAGQHIVRLNKFDLVSVRCPCGRRFPVTSDDLLFVTVASLSIQHLELDSFAVERGQEGIKKNLGPMSETELWTYLNSRTLIDIIPSQVFTFLNTAKALDLDMVLAVLRPQVARPVASRA
jgi:hypothetical protein